MALMPFAGCQISHGDPGDLTGKDPPSVLRYKNQVV